MYLKWVPTAEVQRGDRIACLLSDARSFPEVTGWSDRTLGDGYVQRIFTIGYAPWWVTCDDSMMRFALNGLALIVAIGPCRESQSRLCSERW